MDIVDQPNSNLIAKANSTSNNGLRYGSFLLSTLMMILAVYLHYYGRKVENIKWPFQCNSYCLAIKEIRCPSCLGFTALVSTMSISISMPQVMTKFCDF